MFRQLVYCYLLLILSGLIVLSEDLTFSRTRPLMALCTELQDKYGLLVTYEDAPGDPITEVNSEIRSNGVTFLSPKWKTITFHIPSGLPTRPDLATPLSGAVDAGTSLATVQDVVRQYNASGNPGRFTVTSDGEYLHVAQTARMVNGKFERFEPVTDTVLAWNPKTGTCRQVLGDLFAALRQQRSITVVEGAVPMGALLMTHCKVEGKSVTARQILAAVADGLDTDPVTGKKMGSDAWYLVYDPNGHKYFLSFVLVRNNRPKATVGTRRAA